MTISAASDPALGIALVRFGAEIDQGRAPMKRLTSLGVVALAAAAVALGGVASPVAAKKVCSDSSGGGHIKHPQKRSGKDARTGLAQHLADPEPGPTPEGRGGRAG